MFDLYSLVEWTTIVQLIHVSWMSEGYTRKIPTCDLKLNKFRKRVKNVVTSKGIEVGIECK